MAKKRKASEEELSSNSFEPEQEQEQEQNDSNVDISKILEAFTKEQLIELLKTAVTTNPKLIDQINLIADSDPTQRKLFIHGLGWETSSEKLGEYFSQYGEIEDCNVVTDKITGKSKGYGFICFKTRKDAEKALKEPQKKIESRMTACQLASAGPVITNLQQPLQNNALNNEAMCRKIYVGNVHSDISSEKLLAFFTKYGEIEEGPLGVDKMTGKFKGFALFIYKTVEGAKKALEEQTKNFEGHQLVCQRATDNHKQKGAAANVSLKTPSIAPGGGYNVPGVVGYTAPNAVMASQGLAVNPAAFYGQGLIGGPQQFGQGVVPIQAALAVLAAAGQNPAAFGVPQVMPGYGMVNSGYQNPQAHQANPYQSGPVGQGSAPRPNSAMGPKGGGYRGR
ncbi:hypothetical protein IFM89_024900 [Coptis chinensis]|uniref:RRM domain-containing protein n=1 Tax=Coptis chinensis TaxID=261450 RepID=A0A835I536_9MAGN|nr:hypothetical protein IFM89_024900 [Coptis chinensis]